MLPPWDSQQLGKKKAGAHTKPNSACCTPWFFLVSVGDEGQIDGGSRQKRRKEELTRLVKSYDREDTYEYVGPCPDCLYSYGGSAMGRFPFSTRLELITSYLDICRTGYLSIQVKARSGERGLENNNVGDIPGVKTVTGRQERSLLVAPGHPCRPIIDI
jgi:hypothetical protein